MTATQKHTPGPWLSFGRIVTADDQLSPGYTVEVCRLPEGNVNLANVNLVCAAPELLEALKWAVVHLERLDATNPTLSQARAAIRHAEGKE